jgi:hypothetical protein
VWQTCVKPEVANSAVFHGTLVAMMINVTPHTWECQDPDSFFAFLSIIIKNRPDLWTTVGVTNKVNLNKELKTTGIVETKDLLVVY